MACSLVTWIKKVDRWSSEWVKMNPPVAWGERAIELHPDLHSDVRGALCAMFDFVRKGDKDGAQYAVCGLVDSPEADFLGEISGDDWGSGRD